MSYELTGTLCHIGQTQQVSDKFRKREFVIETKEGINGNSYTNYAKFQAVQNKCDILDNYREGQEVKVSFNVKGNTYEKNGQRHYITNLDAWRIESTGAKPQGNGVPDIHQQGDYIPPVFGGNPESNDDLPF